MDQTYKDEYVLGFPTSSLVDIGDFQGLNFNPDKYLCAIKKDYEYRKRIEAENDPTFKQLIPYAILHCRGRVFSYCRGALLSENRLLNNYSVGIGGHIAIEDDRLFSTIYEEGMQREVHEEVHIGSKYVYSTVALLNDDSNEVGKVHLGVIHVFNLEGENVRKKEKSINEPTFLTIEDLKKYIDRYENWSQICIQNIEKLINNSLIK